MKMFLQINWKRSNRYTTESLYMFFVHVSFVCLKILNVLKVSILSKTKHSRIVFMTKMLQNYEKFANNN